MRRLLDLRIPTLLVAACLVVALTTDARAWVQTQSLSGIGDEAVTAVAVDGGGDVVAAGKLGIPYFAVGKFSGANGSALWPQLYVLIPDLCGVANGLAIESNGDVIAVGHVCDDGTGTSNGIVVRLSGTTGSEVWRRTITGNASQDEDVTAVTLDAVGNVVITGWAMNTGAGEDLFVGKLAAATGADVWPLKFVNGNANQSDRGAAVALDGSGDIAVAGLLTQTGFQQDFLVMKFAGGSGTELWRHTINGTNNGNDAAKTVLVDGAGDVVAGGRVHGSNSDDFAVVKLAAASGAEVWRTVIDLGPVDECRSLQVAPNGDVFAAGILGSGTGPLATVFRLEATTGLKLWTRPVLPNASTGGPSIARGPANDLVVGFSPSNGTDSDAVAAKLDADSGIELWRHVVNGSGTASADHAFAVAVDANDDVILGGATVDAGTNQDFMVAKISGGPGGDFPCGNAIVDGGEECDDGNTIACDACSSTCTNVSGFLCGDGTRNGSACNEQCDDGNLTNGDGCDDACKIETLDATHARCQEAIAKAGAGYTSTVLKALQKCRNRVNNSTLQIVFGQCPSDPQTAGIITRAETKLRGIVAGKCSDAVLADLSLCAATVDGLVGASPTGCLITEHRAAVDAVLFSEYGR